jgi:Lipase (class 3)
MSDAPPLSPSVFADRSFALVWLGLASMAYIQSGNKNNAVIAKTLRYAFNPSDGAIYAPPPPNPSGTGALTGYWQVDWGPGITGDNSNLLYLVSFRQGRRPEPSTQAPGAPYFFAVAIRGTDTHSGPLALIQQIAQDFNAFTLTSLKDTLAAAPNPAQMRGFPDGGSIAHGSAGGFQRMAALTASYADPKTLAAKTGTIADVLLAMADAYPGVPLVVTGHSLGGCQTQIMAAYLQRQLGPRGMTLYPNPIAPSTAGNRDFAAYYSTTFPGGHFWFNDKDIVPCGFANLDETLKLWQTCAWPPGSRNPVTGADVSNAPGPACPALLTDLVRLVGWEIKLLHYARPSVGLEALQGTIPTPDTLYRFLRGSDPSASDDALKAKAMDGTTMLMWQHFPPAYYEQMAAISGVLPYENIDPDKVPVQG